MMKVSRGNVFAMFASEEKRVAAGCHGESYRGGSPMKAATRRRSL